MNPHEDTSDEELFSRTARGDSAAFELLVRRYQDRMMKTIIRIIGDAHEAEDIAQEALIRAYRAASSYRKQSSFKTWLYRIVVNTALTRRRKIVPEPHEISEHALTNPVSPEEHFTRQERNRIIASAVHDLPENQRTALVLRRFEECSYSEVAEIMNIPVTTVEGLISRAYGTLRNRLREFALE